MSFAPRSVRHARTSAARRLDIYQRRALLGMLGMVLVTFLLSNVWALLWQESDWLVATVLPAVVVDMTNDEREGLAAPQLRRSEALDAAAQAKAEHMAAEGYFAHYSPTGVTPWHWFGQANYEFVHAGENLAVHFSDSRALVRAWMDSPTHRANIVNQQFTEIGVGTARGEYQGYPTTFVVQLFGTPAAPRTPEPVATAPTEPAADEPIATTAPTTTPTTPTSSLAAADEPATATTPATSPSTVAGEAAPEQDSELAVATDAAPSPAAAASASSTPPAAETTPASPSVATNTAPSSTPPVTVNQVATAGGTPASYVWQTGTITTSTDRAVATATAVSSAGTTAGVLGVLTQPRFLLQVAYGGLSLTVLFWLAWAIRLEARRHQFMQLSYSVGLLLLMVTFWYVHVSVTSGAAVI